MFNATNVILYLIITGNGLSSNKVMLFFKVHYSIKFHQS